jgi:phosphoribosyl 1,2-cyclic phosphate phosphodiesterase
VGPDLDSKCLLQIVKKVDAILFTHEHADHTAGIDIRPFNFKQGKFLFTPIKE